MARERQRSRAAGRAAEGSKQFTETVKRSRFGVWLLLWIVVALPVSIFCLYFALPLLGLDDPELVGQVIYVSSIVLTVVPIAMLFIASRRKGTPGPSGPSGLAPLPQLTVSCRTCGAPVVFEPGVASAQCSYCRSANLAPVGVVAPMESWAQENTRRAEQAQTRSEQEAERAAARAQAVSRPTMRILQALGQLWPAAFFLTLALTFGNTGSRVDRRGALFFGALGVAWLLGVGLRALKRR